jgi:Arc/MetJ-type ribon-helix-helix transcriptional regulator
MSETLNIRVPELLVDAIARAAAGRMQSKSEFVRQALLDRLQRDGIDVGAPAGAADRRAAQ